MTNRTAEPPVQHHASDAPPPAARGLDANPSVRKASLTAGVALLLMSALAAFGVFVAVEGLVTQGDAARTANDIMASESLFRFGIVSLFLVIALDVVVAWALYRVFSPVSIGVSRLAAWLRLLYAAVFMVAVSELVGALRLLSNEGYLVSSVQISCRPRRSCGSKHSLISGALVFSLPPASARARLPGIQIRICS